MPIAGPNLALKLSTGYEVEVDFERSSRTWRGHLARAILGERFFAEARRTMDRRHAAAHYEVIGEEARHVIATTDLALKDLLLLQIFSEDVERLVKRLERKTAAEKEAGVLR